MFFISAHQIINDSKAPLRYLAVSTMLLPELVEYPDSGKLGVIAGTQGGRAPVPDAVRHFTRLKDGVDYWNGEACRGRCETIRQLMGALCEP